MEVKLHFETLKRNKIVKLYCVFDAEVLFFPLPLPANIPQSLPPTPPGLELAQTPPGNIKVPSQALIEETLYFSLRAPKLLFCGCVIHKRGKGFIDSLIGFFFFSS